MRKTKIAQIITLLFAGAALTGAAAAAPVAVINTINGNSVDAGAVDVGAVRTLVITGYAMDGATKDAGTLKYLLVKNTSTGNSYQVPVIKRLAAPEAVVAAGLAKTASSFGTLMNAGFMATLDAYTLPAGPYEVTGLQFMAYGSTNTNTITPATKPTFSLPSGRTVSDVVLADSSGVSIPVSLKPSGLSSAPDVLNLTGYPALKSGLYQLKAKAANKYGRAGQESALNIRYTRPVVKVDVSSPNAENYPGTTKGVSLQNPLDSTTLTGDLAAKATLQSDNPYVSDVQMQGASLTTNSETDIVIPFTSGRQQVKARAAGQGKGTVKVWLAVPDAPDLEVGVGVWDPDVGIKLAADREVYAPVLDPVSVTASPDPSTNCASGLYGIMDGATVGTQMSTPVCAVRYRALPQGLGQETTLRANLRGALVNLDGNDIDYDTGVLYTDPSTGVTNFYKTKNRKLSLQGIDPAEPAIDFVHVDKLFALAKNSQGTNLTYAGPNTPGRLMMTGKYPGMTANISVGDASPKQVTTSSTNIREFVNTSIPSIWGTQDVVIESWYNKYPQKKFTKTLTFTAIPKYPVVVVSPTQTVSTVDAVVRGNLGVYQGATSGFAFDPAATGEWAVHLYEVSPKGEKTPIGDPASVTSSDGAFEINLGKLAPGRKSIIAVGTVQNAAGGIGQQQITSATASMIVMDGSPIDASLQVKTPSGPTPFMPSIGVAVKKVERVSDIGAVEWYSSRDGEVFDKIDGAGNIGLRPSLPEAGRYWYKAVVTNKYSNEPSELAPVEVQAFNLPKVKILGDTATFVGVPITLTATADVDSDFTWYIYKSATDANPQVVSGNTISVSPSAPGDMLIKVKAVEKGAPTSNVASTVTASTALRAINPIVQRPMITGPGYVETGKTYDFKATMSPLFAPGLTTSLAQRGRWVLPDGSTQEANVISYTVNPGDKSLKYEVWVESMPAVRSSSEMQLRTWTYIWPDWQVTTRVIDNRVPATLMFSAMPKDMRALQNLGSEKPAYQWQLPPSFKIVQQYTPDSITVEASEPGTFQVKAVVSDSRGNTTEVASNMIEIAPAPDLVPDLTLLSGDKWGRAPQKLYARVNILSMPKNDSFGSATFKLDGKEVSSGAVSTTFIDVPTSGTHEVSAMVSSAGGKVATVSKSMDFITGDNPVCSIVSAGDGKTSLTLTAKCTVQSGFISAYKWEVDGKTLPGSSYMVSFSKSSLDAGVGTVRLVAATDKGQEGEAVWTK